MGDDQRRRRIPRTDVMLTAPSLAAAITAHGKAHVKAALIRAQQEARTDRLPIDRIEQRTLELVAELLTARRGHALTPALNATGVIVHTNLGRAPLSDRAVQAMIDASGACDLEFDLATGQRSRRGTGALAALLDCVPSAQDALVVNNGAAALMLATTALARDRELIVSRGELVEIGDGFRLPDLIAATGVRLREIGTTNRTTLADYRGAVGPATGAILKVHPSNFVVRGFTEGVSVAALRDLGVPVIADIGSGLMSPHPLLPDEPDAQTWLAAGADLVTASGDKLLGGPQAGIVLGRSDLVQQLRRHPMARALRVDKLTLAALAATLEDPSAAPVRQALEIDLALLRTRTETLAEQLHRRTGTPVEVVDSTSRVGGGGAPEHPLPSVALSLPEDVAARLRTGSPAVVGRLAGGRCLLDLRCVPERRDADLVAAVVTALSPEGSRKDQMGPREDRE